MAFLIEFSLARGSRLPSVLLSACGGGRRLVLTLGREAFGFVFKNEFMQKQKNT